MGHGWLDAMRFGGMWVWWLLTSWKFWLCFIFFFSMTLFLGLNKIMFGRYAEDWGWDRAQRALWAHLIELGLNDWLAGKRRCDYMCISVCVRVMWIGQRGYLFFFFFSLSFLHGLTKMRREWPKFLPSAFFLIILTSSSGERIFKWLRRRGLGDILQLFHSFDNRCLTKIQPIQTDWSDLTRGWNDLRGSFDRSTITSSKQTTQLKMTAKNQKRTR